MFIFLFLTVPNKRKAYYIFIRTTNKYNSHISYRNVLGVITKARIYINLQIVSHSFYYNTVT